MLLIREIIAGKKCVIYADEQPQVLLIQPVGEHEDATLRAVQVTWTAIKQNANNKAICDTAEELLTHVGDLLERVQKVGKKLDEAQTAYEAVLDKANKGQSVLGSARKLVKLGAKVSTVHPLPQHESDEEPTPQLPSAK